MVSTGISRIEGLDPATAIKAPCRMATTANVTLSGLQTHDGVAGVEDDRLLVRAQDDTTENGIYLMKDTAYVRADDFNGNRDVVDDTLVNVNSGTSYANTTWRVNATNPVVIGTSAITFSITQTLGTSTTINYATVVAAAAAITAGDVGTTIATTEHTATYGYEGGNTYLVKSGTITDDNGSLIQGTKDTSVYLEGLFLNGINVKQFGARGNGVTDDILPDQACVDYVQNILAGGVVNWPNGTFEHSSALTTEAGHGLILQGNGRASIIQNTTSGNTFELGDDITSTNDCEVNRLMLINSNANSACIYARKRRNLRVTFCVIQDSGTDGYGVRMEESWGSAISLNTFQGSKGCAIHLSDDCHSISITENRMDGNGSDTFPSIGVFVEASANVSISSGNVIESYSGAAIYGGAQCRALEISGNYFEQNGHVGLTFTGDVRTIKSDIILNGGVFPALNSANAVGGCTVSTNYFQPLTSNIKSSIYLIGSTGFKEFSNEVTGSYNVADAAFIMSKNNSGFYSNIGAELGNSNIGGFPTDKYFIMEAVNDTGSTSYHEETLRSMIMSPTYAPRFNAHEDGGFDPTTYGIIVNSSNTLTPVLATPKYLGRDCYDITRAGAGSSDRLGITIAEADYDGFYDDELWVAYFKVKSVTNTPGFEMAINVGGGYLESGGGSALTTSYSERVVVFKPQTGTDFTFTIRMNGGTGADVVRMTKPIICPLGSLGQVEMLR